MAAACVITPTRTNFWDPAGSVASRPNYFEHIPQVSGSSVMCRCAQGLYDTTCSVLCDASHFALMPMLLFLVWMVPYVSLMMSACVATFAVHHFIDFHFDAFVPFCFFKFFHHLIAKSSLLTTLPQRFCRQSVRLIRCRTVDSSRYRRHIDVSLEDSSEPSVVSRPGSCWLFST